MPSEQAVMKYGVPVALLIGTYIFIIYREAEQAEIEREWAGYGGYMHGINTKWKEALFLGVYFCCG